jgi:hypothetical protein
MSGAMMAQVQGFPASSASAQAAAMPRGMMAQVQGFLASRFGSQWTALTPSLKCILKMNPDSPVHREALGAMAAQLNAIKGFENDLADPAKRQVAATEILQANHVAEHAARVEAVLRDRLGQIKLAAKKRTMDKNEQRAAILELSPLMQIGYAFKTAKSEKILNMAERMAANLDMSAADVNREFVDAADIEALQRKADYWLAEGKLKPFSAPIKWKPALSVRPLQANAGMIEVAGKMRELQSMPPQQLIKFLLKKPIPVAGRKKKDKKKDFQYDHHHELLATWKAGIEVAPVAVGETVKSNFWRQMKKEKKVWLHDASGEKISHRDLPGDIRGLGDDPYRSLSGKVRDLGGYSKTGEPFAEFHWALFFRKHLKARPDQNFDQAVKEAMVLAKDPRAKSLPGYIGGKKK